VAGRKRGGGDDLHGAGWYILYVSMRTNERFYIETKKRLTRNKAMTKPRMASPASPPNMPAATGPAATPEAEAGPSEAEMVAATDGSPVPVREGV